MQKLVIVSTVIIALILMGCPPPVSDASNPPAQSSDNSNTFAGSKPQPKAIVVSQVSAGSSHTMILKTDHTLWAVGDNGQGRLGDGSTDNKNIPVQVMIAEGEPMTEVKQVSAGTSHTMIVKKNGELWAVGRNDDGQLGNGKSGRNVLEVNPVKVITAAGSAMTEVDRVSISSLHTMIVKKGGTLWAVGLNTFGQLGDNTQDTRVNPVAVLTAPLAAGGGPMTDVKQVSAGGAHTMILKENDTLWAVGLNNFGQLGDSTTNHANIPVQVRTAPAPGGGPITEVDQVSSGFEHTMILKINGELWAVGRNHKGQLGDGTGADTSTPVAVKQPSPGGAVAQPMTGVKQVSAGHFHTMIVKRNGELWAVGDNTHGQLGDGTTSNTNTPVQVLIATGGRPMTEVDQVSSGGGHSMIIKRGGSLWAVGKNDKGQLGNGKSGADAKELIPVEITVE